MPGVRDLVHFNPSQRVDLPDFLAIQENARSDTRSSFVHMLFGDQIAANQQQVFGGFDVAEAGAPDTTVVVSNGNAISAELLDDGVTYEYGVSFGLNGPTSQVLEFSGAPAATYDVYVRFKQDLGALGNRIFWNEDTQLEDVDSVNTRRIVTWDALRATTAVSNDWVKVAEVVWDGVGPITNSEITMLRPLFFEGIEAAFAHLWGDGVNDRNADRGQYGIKDMYRWVHAVRRQLDEIIGGTGWYVVPTDSLNGHIAEADNPHPSPLLQDSMVIGDGVGGGYLEILSGASLRSEDGFDLIVSGVNSAIIGGSGAGANIDWLAGAGGDALLRVSGGPSVRADGTNGEIRLDGGDTRILAGNALIVPNKVQADSTPVIEFSAPSEMGSSICGAAVLAFFADPYDSPAPSGSQLFATRGTTGGSASGGLIFTESGAVYFCVPLSYFGIPNGAVIESFGFSGDGTAANSQIDVTLIETTRSTGVVATNGGTATDTGAVPLTDRITGVALTVDYQGSDYYLLVELTGGTGGSSQVELFGVFCNWTQAGVIPNANRIIL